MPFSHWNLDLLLDWSSNAKKDSPFLPFFGWLGKIFLCSLLLFFWLWHSLKSTLATAPAWQEPLNRWVGSCGVGHFSNRNFWLCTFLVSGLSPVLEGKIKQWIRKWPHSSYLLKLLCPSLTLFYRKLFQTPQNLPQNDAIGQMDNRKQATWV